MSEPRSGLSGLICLMIATVLCLSCSRSVESIITDLKDKDWTIRKRAAESLGKIKDPRAVQPLITALKDKRMSVRFKVARALGEIKDPRAVQPLITALRDEEWLVRREAAWALKAIGSPAVQPLITALREGNRWYQRDDVAQALGKIKDPRAVQPLITALRDGTESVRTEVARALGEIKDPRAVQPLITALKDERESVREEAAWALGEIGDKAAVKPLVDNLTDWYSNKKFAGALAMLGWEPQSDKDKIHLWVAQRKKSKLLRAWRLTQEVLLADVQSGNYRIIENALFAFIGIGKEEIIPILIQTLGQKGGKAMAEAYLNCGHGLLDKAARSWAARHGYAIFKGSGAHPVGWGSM